LNLKVKVKITIDESVPNLNTGFLISEDRVDEVLLSSLVMDWSFKRELWTSINTECDSNIDEYEDIWLDAAELHTAARIIRGDLIEDADLPAEYRTFLLEAPEMLERCASRGTRVQFCL
jgi:hypothetical protein